MERLKVGILINSLIIQKWQFEIISQMNEAQFCDIDLLILRKAKGKTLVEKVIEKRKNLIYYFLIYLDKRLFKNKTEDATAEVDSEGILNSVDRIIAGTRRVGKSEYLEESDLMQIRKYDLDVIIRFGFGILKGGILDAAKFGTWSFHHGDNKKNRGIPACYWEVINKSPVTGFIIQRLGKRLDDGKILSRGYLMTDQLSFSKTKNKVIWRSTLHLIRLLQLLARNKGDFENKINAYEKPLGNFYSEELFRLPKNGTSVMHLVKYFSRLSYYALEKAIKRKRWRVYFRYSKEKAISLAPYQYKTMRQSTNHFFADPQLVEGEDKVHIFYENYDYRARKAHISHSLFNENGQMSEPRDVLKEGFHLSYPFVFEYEDKYYMIPETSSNRTISLYESVAFPYKWQFKHHILENIVAADTTLLQYKDRWWMFTSIDENGKSGTNDELFIFHSQNPIRGEWIPHLMNPVISDARVARPAGKIFEVNGSLVRPSQNCSGIYGRNIVFSRICVLSTEEYEEEVIDSIEPNWKAGLIASHTFNFAGGLTVVDGQEKKISLFR